MLSALTAVLATAAIAAHGTPFAAQKVAPRAAEPAPAPDLVVTQVPLTPFATNNDASYRIIVGNVGRAVSRGIYRVDGTLAPHLLLARAPHGTGWECTGAQGDTAFACTSRDAIAPAAANENDIVVPVIVLPEAVGTDTTRLVQSAVAVAGGGESQARRPSAAERAAAGADRKGGANSQSGARPPLADCPPLPKFIHNACRTPTRILRAASIAGTAWFDRGDIASRLDAADQRLADWPVEIVDAETLLGQVVRRTTTGADGRWQVTDLIPGREYLVRFRDPVSGVVAALPSAGDATSRCTPAGQPASIATTQVCIEDEWATQLRVSLAAGAAFDRAHLAHAGAGSVYDVATGAPIAGAVVTLNTAGACPNFNPAEHVVNAQIGGYRIAGPSIAMTTGATGAYRFALTPTAPATCDLRVTVAPPGGWRVADDSAGASKPRLPAGKHIGIERILVPAPGK